MAGRETEGTVQQALPGGLYEVSLEHGETIKASIGGIARQTTVRVIAGDRVIVEVSSLDPTRGKIVRRIA